MNKVLVSLFLAILFNQANQIEGLYRNNFGSRIEINSDKSFKYTWNFDLASSWTKGVWILKNDTLYLSMIEVYDTLFDNGSRSDANFSLHLSANEKAERITNSEAIISAISGGGQNRRTHPEKLLYKKGRLYEIKNGKLVDRKQRDILSRKKMDPWYSKVLD